MWMVLLPTLFPRSTLLADPLHSTSVPFSAEVAVPLSVDVKEVAVVPGPKPVPALAVKTLPKVCTECCDYLPALCIWLPLTQVV